MSIKKMSKKNITYTGAVKQIEEILHKIENNELDVDELTKLVRSASDLIKYCKSMLFETEQEIEKILNDIENDEGKKPD
jgi:exodeoxyribonuclease VII small subunit